MATNEIQLLLNPRRAARALSISERTLAKLTKDGEIKCLQIGQARKFSVASLEAWVAEKENRAAKGYGRELNEFVDSYIASRADVKPRTKERYSQARRLLLGYFDASKLLHEFTPADADSWRIWLLTKARGDHGLADNTVRRHCGRVRQFFRAAIKQRKSTLVEENPFAELPTVVYANKARQYFVSREETAAVIAKTKDPAWKAIIALSRYAGPAFHLKLSLSPGQTLTSLPAR